MVLSKLLYAFLSLTSISTIYLLSENKKMCHEVEVLREYTCVEVDQLNTERLDRVAERLFAIERVSEEMWNKKR